MTHWHKKKVIRMWRKYGFGRLYWRRAHPSWREAFFSDDVAIAREGTVAMHFRSLEAIETYLKTELIERNVGEK